MIKIEEEIEPNGEPNLDDIRDFISTEIIKLNANVQTLKDFLKLIGTARDNAGLRRNVHTIQARANTSIHSVTNSLKKVKHATPKENKLDQLQNGKMEETFLATINNYNSAQREIAQKQKSHILLTANEENPPSDDEQLQTSQRQSQLMRDLKEEELRMLEQQKRLMGIQTDIINVHQIMNELGSMVEKQAPVMDKIERDVTEVAERVEDGANQLEAGVRHRKVSRRTLCLISVAVIIILFAVLVYYCLSRFLGKKTTSAQMG